jgi:glucan 1,3-beta-glucosidase
MSSTPLASASVDELNAPRAPYLDNHSASPTPSSNSAPLLTPMDKNESGAWDNSYSPPAKRRRRGLWMLTGAGILVVVVLVVILPVYFTVIRPKQNSESSSSGSGGSNGGNPGSPTGAITGGDGSEIKLADGSTFTYKNQFGGFCEFHLYSLASRGCRRCLNLLCPPAPPHFSPVFFLISAR